MKSKSDLPHCILIQKYIRNVLMYTEGLDEKAFNNSQVIYDACILNFINIGEQVKAQSPSFKTEYEDIPYRKIIGMRNIAAHSYEGLEAFRLFIVIKQDLPWLLERFTEIINSNTLE